MSGGPAPQQQQLPLQGADRAPFRGDPVLENALELASVNPRAPRDSHQDGEFVVVNLGESLPPQVRGAKGEGSNLKKAKPKYGAVGDDVELGPKHVSNASKDDAADGETVCRVCHLGLNSGSGESIELGCACKQDLALCHRSCAEEWFKIRGNTVCEICGETAKNVHIPEPLESTAAHLEANGAEPHTHREFANATAMTRLRYCWTRQLVRNALLVSLVVVCTVPWFFRVVKFGMYLWANQLIRNSLLASMIVVFMVPWFFRIAYF